MRHSCFALVCFALAGCATSDPARRDPVVTGAIPETVAVEAPSSLLFELPAEMGVVAQVRERAYANGFRQEIALKGGERGENVVDISIEGPAGGAGALQVSRPSEGGVRGEIIARFPGVAMRIVTKPMSNAAGPFGLAIGKAADGTRCVFAWQWIDDMRAPGGGGAAGFASLVSSRAAPASVRVRLCRRNVTVDELAGLVQQMRSAGPAAVDRVLAGGARASSAGLAPGVVGPGPRADTIAVGPSLESALSGGAGPVAAPARAAAPRKPTRRRRAARDKKTEPAQETVVPQSGYAGGPRYMAPVPSGATGPGASMAPPSSGGFNPRLPAAAYRGPQRSAASPAQGY